jgi:hypothetical protein
VRTYVRQTCAAHLRTLGIDIEAVAPALTIMTVIRVIIAKKKRSGTGGAARKQAIGENVFG